MILDIVRGRETSAARSRGHKALRTLESNWLEKAAG